VALALERHARDVARRDQQQHDHDAGAEGHRDQALAGVVASVVEGPLGRARPFPLVRGEPVGGVRHRAEACDLRAQEDVLDPLFVARAQRTVGLAVEPHELAELPRQLGEQLALAPVGERAGRGLQIAGEARHRALEHRTRPPLVIAVRRLPAVHVRHAELQLERDRLVAAAVLHLVEAVPHLAHAVERHRGRGERPEDRQDDRRIELRADRHGLGCARRWSCSCSPSRYRRSSRWRC
jgi:hypothetical protein